MGWEQISRDWNSCQAGNWGGWSEPKHHWEIAKYTNDTGKKLLLKSVSVKLSNVLGDWTSSSGNYHNCNGGPHTLYITAAVNGVDYDSSSTLVDNPQYISVAKQNRKSFKFSFSTPVPIQSGQSATVYFSQWALLPYESTTANSSITGGRANVMSIGTITGSTDPGEVTPETITVTYKLNGGKISGSSDDIVREVEPPFNIISTKPAKASETVNSYTVTLNANGGSLNKSSLSDVVTRSFTFLSWNTSKSGSGTSYNSGAQCNATSDIVLYAQYSSKDTHSQANFSSVTGTKSYKLKYSVNTTSATNDIAHVYTDSSSGVTSTVTRSTSSVSFNTKSDGSGTTYSGSVNLSKNLTLYAIWGNIKVGDLPVYRSATNPRIYRLTNSNKYGLLDSYGWTYSSGWTSTDRVRSSDNLTENTTIYAQWKVAVDLDPNGGQWSASDSSVRTIWMNRGSGSLPAGPLKPNKQGTQYTATFHSNYNPDSTTTKSARSTIGYSFYRWNTASDGSGTNYTTGHSFTNRKSYLKVYATYSDSVISQASITLPSISRRPFEFLGWYSSKSGGTKLGDAGDTYILTRNINMYAQWQIVSPVWILIQNTDGTKEWVRYFVQMPDSDEIGYMYVMGEDHRWHVASKINVLKSKKWKNAEDLL